MAVSRHARVASTTMYLIAGSVAAAVITASSGGQAVLLGVVAVACSVAVGRETRRDDILAWTVFVCANALTLCLMALPAALHLTAASSRPSWLPTVLVSLSGFGLVVAALRGTSARRRARLGA